MADEKHATHRTPPEHVRAARRATPGTGPREPHGRLRATAVQTRRISPRDGASRPPIGPDGEFLRR